MRERRRGIQSKLMGGEQIRGANAPGHHLARAAPLPTPLAGCPPALFFMHLRGQMLLEAPTFFALPQAAPAPYDT